MRGLVIRKLNVKIVDPLTGSILRAGSAVLPAQCVPPKRVNPVQT